MSQSLADLFASETVKKNKPHKPHPVETASMQQNIPLAYPVAETITDVIPPDEGNS